MLEAINVDKEIAARVAKEAQGKTEGDAQRYVDQNGAKGKPILRLNREQQILMQSLYLPDYEITLIKHLATPVLQREYEALVSLTTNPSVSIVSVTTLLNQGKVAAALENILNRIHVGSSIQCGIIARRRREVEWFISGRYTKASCGK